MRLSIRIARAACLAGFVAAMLVPGHASATSENIIKFFERNSDVFVTQGEWAVYLTRADGERFTFLSDQERRYLDDLGLRETTDTVHHPYRPAAFMLYPDLRIHAAYNGYWYWGRPTLEEIRLDMRAISHAIRSDWELS